MLFGSSPFKPFLSSCTNQSYTRIWKLLQDKDAAGQLVSPPDSGHSVPSSYTAFLKKHLRLEHIETLSPEALLADPFLQDAQDQDVRAARSRLESSLGRSFLGRSTLNASTLDASQLFMSQLEVSQFGQTRKANPTVSNKQQQALYQHFERLVRFEVSKLEFLKKLVELGQKLAALLAASKKRPSAQLFPDALLAVSKLQLQLLGKSG